MREYLQRSFQVKAVLVLLLATLAFTLTEFAKPNQKLIDKVGRINIAAALPAKVGSWQLDTAGSGQIVNPQQEAALAAIYNQVVSRTYVDPEGNRLMMVVAYGEDQRDAMALHYPEVCYPSQGFEILTNQTSVVATSRGQVPVRQLVARQGRRNEPVTYWVVIGDQATRSGIDKKIVEFRYAKQRTIPDGLLFRLSTIDADPQHAFALQADFAHALVDALDAAALPRLTGLN
ncbi:MAG: EpsI family protein [Burkholderiales bacterium PBB6]|nr:MAG: EpsI family protein [Burkholderiales bacterium PBB6]